MQSRWMSLLEWVTNIVVGYCLAVLTQVLVFPLFELSVSLGENLGIGAIFTVISLLRSFALRRLFNHVSAPTFTLHDDGRGNRMARGKPVELGTRSFPNQKLANDHFSGMLGNYKPGDRVNDEDKLDLAALLERHPEYKQKIGVGVDHFEVMKTHHGTNCFRVVRLDGSGTDFSIGSCVTGRAPTRKQEVPARFVKKLRSTCTMHGTNSSRRTVAPTER